jgi:septal ring factor EnvC (AmiA/AmiB activator)
MKAMNASAAILLCQLLSFISFSQKKETADFEKCKGRLPFPVCKVYGYNDARCEKTERISPAYFNISFITDSAAEIRAVHAGNVSKIFSVEDGYAIVIKSGDYYVTYYPLQNAAVHKGDYIINSQPIAIASSPGQQPEINILISKAMNFIDPYK